MGLQLNDKQLARLHEQRTFAAGGGVWFSKLTNEQVIVSVRFYPKTVLTLNGQTVTKEQLEREYYRLRV